MDSLVERLGGGTGRTDVAQFPHMVDQPIKTTRILRGLNGAGPVPIRSSICSQRLALWGFSPETH